MKLHTDSIFQVPIREDFVLILKNVYQSPRNNTHRKERCSDGINLQMVGEEIIQEET